MKSDKYPWLTVSQLTLAMDARAFTFMTFLDERPPPLEDVVEALIASGDIVPPAEVIPEGQPASWCTSNTIIQGDVQS